MLVALYSWDWACRQEATREPRADKPVAARVPEAGMQGPMAGQGVAWATQAYSSVQKHRSRQA